MNSTIELGEKISTDIWLNVLFIITDCVIGIKMIKVNMMSTERRFRELRPSQ